MTEKVRKNEGEFQKFWKGGFGWPARIIYVYSRGPDFGMNFRILNVAFLILVILWRLSYMTIYTFLTRIVCTLFDINCINFPYASYAATIES